MWETRILRGADSDVQKTLNQWRHEYKLKIHPNWNLDSKDQVVLIVARKKK